MIDAVVPDYHARFPKPCVGGWGRRSLNVTPSGKVLPCHAAESIPGLEFWNVREHSLADIWASSPAFNAFRGTDFLPEPCASCERREIDFGGCRCQAFALTGDARATDPVCHLSPRTRDWLRAVAGNSRAIRLRVTGRSAGRPPLQQAGEMSDTGHKAAGGSGHRRRKDGFQREEKMINFVSVPAWRCCSPARCADWPSGAAPPAAGAAGLQPARQTNPARASRTPTSSRTRRRRP